MADQESQIPSAPFPAPPPFWKHFTSDNISHLKAFKEANTKPEDIPHELTYLKPPPTPAESYTIFGEEQKLSTTLSSLFALGIHQLYPQSRTDIDHPHYLTLILRSLHLNFQELCLILSQNPNLIYPKLDDIKNLFQNAHWLINMYRPHQARETLIAMMEREIEEGRREVEECERVERRAKEVLTGIETAVEDSGVDGAGGDGEGRSHGAENEGTTDKDEEAKRVWKMMTDIDVEAD